MFVQMWNLLVVDLMVMTDEVRIDEPNTSGQYRRNTTNMGNEKQET